MAKLTTYKLLHRHSVCFKGRKPSSRKYTHIIKIQELVSCFPLTVCSWSLSGYWGSRENGMLLLNKTLMSARTRTALGSPGNVLCIWLCLPGGQGEYPADLCSGISVAQWRQL